MQIAHLLIMHLIMQIVGKLESYQNSLIFVHKMKNYFKSSTARIVIKFH